MKLDDIGFYTLSDKRATTTQWGSDLQRCELILTDRCNFHCEYCRGIKRELRGDLSFKEAALVLDLWASGNIHNVRFSGGEPTLWSDLLELVRYTKAIETIQHIAISTNGSASLVLYKELIKAGVNDFSVSLDACCAATADMMAGTNSKFEHICHIISELSKMTYVTVGVVLDDRNSNELTKIIKHASSLGVSDIRIIPSAQWNRKLDIATESKYKILSYRTNNIRNNRHVRGVTQSDSHKCHLVKDDMAVLHGKHFPCIIYMREQGEPIGNIYDCTLTEVQHAREHWFNQHDSFVDPICTSNCLDVCVDYNNAVERLQLLVH